MNFEAVIGLELHVAMKTKTKMFSSAAIDFKAAPNTLVNEVDMAFPGTLPSINKQAVINAIRVCDALHLKIDHELHFDRKNYFYPDLTKGYQITQARRPIGSDGYLDLEVSGRKNRVNIERLHLEEDTAMQHHYSNYSLLDYNRAGIPLVEIVTRPEIHSADEAMKFVETIREIVTYLDVSDGRMEEGNLRCDVNISLRLYGETTLGKKVEIKNLNSIANIGKAIEYEMYRQERALLKGEKIVEETRRYDESSRSTGQMRLKGEAADYKYFPEANIPPIHLSEAFVKEMIETGPELASSKKKRYVETFLLSEYDASIILQNKETSEYFDEASKLTNNYKTLANWVNGEVAAHLNEKQTSIKELAVKPTRLAELVDLIESGQVSNKQGREIFALMLENSDSPLKIAKDHQMMQISDPSVLLPVVIEILTANPQSIEDFKNGKDRAVGFLVGQVMKKMRGKANPTLVNQLVNDELKKY